MSGGEELKRHGLSSVHWMQTIGELRIPVSSAPIKHTLMLAGTKCTLNSVTVEMILFLPAS